MAKRGRKPGCRKTGGRKKGSVNKTTASVKLAMELAFEQMGGVDALVEWGKENPTDFYRLWTKLLPTQVAAEPEPTNDNQQPSIVFHLPYNHREPLPENAVVMYSDK